MKYYDKTQFGRDRTPGDPQRFYNVNSLVWRCGAAGVRALPVLTAHDISLPEQYYVRKLLSLYLNTKEIKIVPEDCRNKSLAQAANILEAGKWQNLIFLCRERADVWLRNIQIHLGKTERLCFFIDSKIEVRNIYVMRHTKDVESQLSPLFIGVEAISTK